MHRRRRSTRPKKASDEDRIRRNPPAPLRSESSQKIGLSRATSRRDNGLIDRLFHPLRPFLRPTRLDVAHELVRLLGAELTDASDDFHLLVVGELFAKEHLIEATGHDIERQATELPHQHFAFFRRAKLPDRRRGFRDFVIERIGNRELRLSL